MDLLRPYCSVDAVRQHLENSSLDEDIAKAAINRASRLLEDRTGRDFWFHDHVTTAYRIKKADIISNLILLPFEIITLTEVSGDGEILTAGEDEDYTYEVGDAAITGGANWEGVIDIKGTFGFALSSVEGTTSPPPLLPEAISTAAIVIASVYTGQWRKSVRAIDGSQESVVMQSIPGPILKSLERFNVRAIRASF